MGIDVTASIAYGVLFQEVEVKGISPKHVTEYFEEIYSDIIGYDRVGSDDTDDFIIYLKNTLKTTQWEGIIVTSSLILPTHEDRVDIEKAMKYIQKYIYYDKCKGPEYILWPYYG